MNKIQLRLVLPVLKPEIRFSESPMSLSATPHLRY
jgi:hypothetical protein